MVWAASDAKHKLQQALHQTKTSIWGSRKKTRILICAGRSLCLGLCFANGFDDCMVGIRGVLFATSAEKSWFAQLNELDSF